MVLDSDVEGKLLRPNVLVEGAQQSSVGSVISPLFTCLQEKHGKRTVTDDSGASPSLYSAL